MNLWFLWEVVVNSIETFLIYYLFSSVLGVRENRKGMALVGMCILIAIVCFLNYLNLQIVIEPDNFVFYPTRFILIIPNVLYSVFFFKGSISKKILWGIAPIAISMIADAGTQWFVSITSNVDLNTATQLGTERFPLTISYLLFAAIIYLILATIARRKTKSVLYLPAYLKIFLFIILIVGIIAVDQLIDSSFEASSMGNVLLSTHLVYVNIAFLAILFSAFLLIEYVGQLAQKNVDYALEIQQTKMEQDYYKKLELTIDMVRENKHDLKNQLQVLHGLLKERQYEELDKYFESLSLKYDNDLSIVLTPNPTINALLSSKLYIAKAEHIRFTYQIQNFEQLPDRYMDICSILGNLLDNAIEACMKISDHSQRFIKLLIENKNEMLIIRIKNSYDGIILKEKNRYLTRKSGAGHGIGLKYINKLVVNHAGHITISTQGHVFTVSVLLPLE